MTVGVVIVNFNCAALALDAALSALGDDPTARVIIVDNASTDNSMDYFRAVCGRELVHKPQLPKLASDMAHAEPNFVCVHDVATALVSAKDPIDHELIGDARLVVCSSLENRGFAAGSNIGLAWQRDAFACDWYMLLNPDALLASGAVRALEDRLIDHRVGLCGATVLRFENPEIVQAFGGATLNPLSLLGKNIGGERSVRQRPDHGDVEPMIDYPLGATIALRADYLEKIGMLDERYFLYYEEADWAFRGRKDYHCGWAPDAIVFHRHGASAGSRLFAKTRSPTADYHMIRSRLLFALRWRCWMVPIIICFSVVQSVRRILRGQGNQARSVLRAVADVILNRPLAANR